MNTITGSGKCRSISLVEFNLSNWWRTSSVSGLTGVLSVQIASVIVTIGRGRTTYSRVTILACVGESKLATWTSSTSWPRPIYKMSPSTTWQTCSAWNAALKYADPRKREIFRTTPASRHAAADATSARSATCEVCLLAPRDGVVLVPRGHSRFCAQCADAVAVMPNGCPLCRTPIDMVMRVYFWCVSGELS